METVPHGKQSVTENTIEQEFADLDTEHPNSHAVLR